MANPTFRRRLLDGEPLVGIITNLDSVDLIEIIGLSGYDYVLLDAEHAAFSDGRLLSMIRAARSVNLPTVVRTRDGHPKSILRACDLGADGIMVPQIDSAADARRVVEAMRYPPDGNRGLHPATPGSLWGTYGLDEHIETQQTGICSLIQIETPQAIEHIDEIAQVTGVDALIVGPSDLSQSMGFSGQPSHPEVEAATEAVFRSARGAGIRAGSVASSPERARYLVERGANFIISGVLGIIVQGLREQRSNIQTGLGD